MRRRAEAQGRARRRRQRGLSLLEVLIAMAILSLCATSLIALLASGSAAHKRAVDRTHAALVAEELFAEVQWRYRIGAGAKDILAGLREGLPERLHGYYWEVRLHWPGAEAQGAKRREEEEGESAWSEEELVVRVAVRSGREDRAREEVYTTILLPRP
jgi:prepilin-type N-terminal cleavage/methylation domain-containing protein